MKKNLLDRIAMGVSAPLSGLQILLSTRRLFILSIFPILLGLGLIIFGFLVAAQFLGPWLTSWLSEIAWLQASQWLLPIVSTVLALFGWLAFSLANFLFGYLLMVILGGPFYSMMAEHQFRMEQPHFEPRNHIGLILKMLYWSLLKVLLFTFIGIFCFFLAFIPVVNFFSSFLVFSLIAFDCMDYAFEVDQKSLASRIRFFFTHIWEFIGLSLAIIGTSFVPGSFFVLLPAFICGATKMYIQLQEEAV
ncbi:MAG: EI24 domain-containing protein [Pseudomonadota bacterium]